MARRDTLVEIAVMPGLEISEGRLDNSPPADMFGSSAHRLLPVQQPDRSVRRPLPHRAERFVVEIKTTAALQHPHILPLFDSGTVDGLPFFVMPYIQGETIREKLNRETQFGVDEAVRIAREVADALDYAHRHGVIHRDIKPENVLLHDGRALVMDFGIALTVSPSARMPGQSWCTTGGGCCATSSRFSGRSRRRKPPAPIYWYITSSARP